MPQGDTFPALMPGCWPCCCTHAPGVLEGIALGGNPNFALVDEAYPYIAKRLLTDDTPRRRAALRYMVYGRQGVFDVDRYGMPVRLLSTAHVCIPMVSYVGQYSCRAKGGPVNCFGAGYTAVSLVHLSVLAATGGHAPVCVGPQVDRAFCGCRLPSPTSCHAMPYMQADRPAGSPRAVCRVVQERHGQHGRGRRHGRQGWRRSGIHSIHIGAR
jgi:hypothetical protein